MGSIQRIELGGKEYDLIKKEFEESVVLKTTDNNVSLVDLNQAITENQNDEKLFFVGYLGNGMFLARASTFFDDREDGSTVHIGPYTLTLYHNLNQVSVEWYSNNRWVRLMSLPVEMRGVECFLRIVHAFGKLIDIDDNTRDNWDLQWARVKVATPPRSVIPPFVPLKIFLDRKHIVFMKVLIEEDGPYSQPLLETMVTDVSVLHYHVVCAGNCMRSYSYFYPTYLPLIPNVVSRTSMDKCKKEEDWGRVDDHGEGFIAKKPRSDCSTGKRPEIYNASAWLWHNFTSGSQAGSKGFVSHHRSGNSSTKNINPSEYTGDAKGEKSYGKEGGKDATKKY